MLTEKLIKIQFFRGGDTPLHAAAMSEHNSFEITELLLTYGARATTLNDR